MTWKKCGAITLAVIIATCLAPFILLILCFAVAYVGIVMGYAAAKWYVRKLFFWRPRCAYCESRMVFKRQDCFRFVGCIGAGPICEEQKPDFTPPEWWNSPAMRYQGFDDTPEEHRIK